MIAMTEGTKLRPISEVFPEWSFTPMGEFLNRHTGNVLSVKDWEMEMSYRFKESEEKLSLALQYAERARNIVPV